MSQNITKFRHADHKIYPLFLERWSPRAMSGENINEEELLTLFEAARWAPSSYNNQPWRFIYALKNMPEWNTFFNLLVEFNQSWVKNAAALILIISAKTFESTGKLSQTHCFDTGAAWENLALQGHFSGLVVHAMEGFDYEQARRELGIPSDFEIHALVAVGRKGRKEDLPPALQEREILSPRKEIKELIFKGKYGGEITW